MADEQTPGGRREYDPPARIRWTDDRLDDFYADFRHTKELAEQVPVIKEILKGMADDVAAGRAENETCRKNIHALRNDIAVNAAQQAVERKTDRRWVIGTIIASAGIVVAAMNVLLGHL